MFTKLESLKWVLFVLLLTVGIGNSGNRPLRAEQWSTSQPTLPGAWSGSWASHTTGHQGPLHASIRSNSDGNYTATFTGKFFKVIPFRYQMQLNVVSNDGHQMTLAGSKKLGPVMGYYSYRATVTGNQLSATYSTKRDRGTFSLRRR